MVHLISPQHSLPSSSYLQRGLLPTIFVPFTWINHNISGSHSTSTLVFVRGGTEDRTYGFLRRRFLTLFVLILVHSQFQASIARPYQVNCFRKIGSYGYATTNPGEKFWFKKIFGSKKFLVKKIFGWKILGEKSFRLKFFWGQNKFLGQKIVKSKNFGSKKFRSKRFGSENFYFQKKIG